MLRDPARHRRSRQAWRRSARFLAIGALVSLTTTACGEALPEPIEGQNPSAYSGLGVGEDRIEYAIGKVKDIVSEEMDAAGTPGSAVAVVHGGEVAFVEGFGVRSSSTGNQVDTDTVFPLASVSKSVSATVVAAESGNGTIDWSTPVRDHLPWFALSEPGVTTDVTVGDLFAHRSGLPEHAGDDLEDIGYDRLAVLHGLRHLPLTPFRASYAYTNFGLTAGAEAVAAAAGAPWNELADERIFTPLGMDDTSFSHDELLERPNRAVGHVRQTAADPAGSSGDWVPADPARDPDAQAPAGGLSSSVSDMARWMSMVLADGRAPGGAQVVPSGALREALTPQAVSSPPRSAGDRTGTYGYGFNISDSSSGRVQWSHSGAFAQGAGTAMLMMPSLDLGIITLTNAAPTGMAETVNSRFADLAQYGDPAQDWREIYSNAFEPLLDPVGDLVTEKQPVSPRPPPSLDGLTGAYRNDYFGTVNVRQTGRNDLVIAAGPDGQRQEWALKHWDGDTFAISPSGENWPAGSRSSVVFDDDTVTIDLLNSNGWGDFARVGDDADSAED